jgi:hypothetical protein
LGRGDKPGRLCSHHMPHIPLGRPKELRGMPEAAHFAGEQGGASQMVPRTCAWTAWKWAKVLWSDESTFTQFPQAHTSCVWRKPKEKWAIACASATVKHSPSRMHWGCFFVKGCGTNHPAIRVGNWSFTRQDFALSHLTYNAADVPKGGRIVQEDNAPPHRSKVAREFRKGRVCVFFLGPLRVLTSTRLRTCGLRSNEAYINVCKANKPCPA